MQKLFHWLANLNGRADAALGRRLAWMERWSRRLGSPACSVIVSLLWGIPIVTVKIVLLRNFILTSDIAYYENMLRNTGVDFSTKFAGFLYTYRDVIYFHSRTFLTEHFSPTFALVAPFYHLWHWPLFLVLLQPGLIALAGAGVYRLARRLMEREGTSALFGLIPLLFQIVYLFNYSNVSATIDTIYGFHHDSLIPPLLVWTLICILESRWKTAAILFTLLLGMKENLPIIFSASCGYGLVFNGLVPRKKAAVGLLLCLAFLAGCYFFEFRTHNRHVALLFQFGSLDNIRTALGRLSQWQLLGYFLPALLTPVLALPALGELSMELMGNTVELDWHSFPLMLLVIAGTLFTGLRVLRWARKSKPVALLLYFAFIGLVVAPVVVDGCHAYDFITAAADRLTPLADAKDLKEIAASIPGDARLATTSDLLTFCADRRYLAWPELSPYADYILVNRRTTAENRAESDEFMAALPFGDDAAGDHFRSDLDYVLQGYAYDDNAIKFVDDQVARHAVVPVRSVGRLTLYRALSPAPTP
jgi:hypothetical protein